MCTGCDGLEYELSVTRVHLRNIQANIASFNCCLHKHDSDQYHSNTFLTPGLHQDNVVLTWDKEEQDRAKAINKEAEREMGEMGGVLMLSRKIKIIYDKDVRRGGWSFPFVTAKLCGGGPSPKLPEQKNLIEVGHSMYSESPEDPFSFVEELSDLESYKPFKRRKLNYDSKTLVGEIIDEIVSESFKEYELGIILSEVVESCTQIFAKEAATELVREEALGSELDCDEDIFSVMFLCGSCCYSTLLSEVIIEHSCNSYLRKEKYCEDCDVVINSAVELDSHCKFYHKSSPLISLKSLPASVHSSCEVNIINLATVNKRATKYLVHCPEDIGTMKDKGKLVNVAEETDKGIEPFQSWAMLSSKKAREVKVPLGNVVEENCENTFGDIERFENVISNPGQAEGVGNLESLPIVSDSNICSSLCQNKQCHIISKQVLNNIQSKLRQLRKSELHQFLLTRLEMQHELGLSTECCFVLEQQIFCHKSLNILVGVTSYMIHTVCSEYEAGKSIVCHGNKGAIYGKDKRDVMISFTQQFAQLPDRTVLRLPAYLNIREIFVNYKETIAEERQVKERSFYQIFKESFGDSSRLLSFLPRIVFLPMHTHPVCTECDRINTMRQKAKNESEKLYAESRKRRHMLEIRRKYLNFTYRRELAVRYPNDVLHIGIDDVDQAKIWSPYQRVNTKEATGLLRLNNHLTGVIVTSGGLPKGRSYICYANNDQFPNDSNKTISILFDVLELVQERLGKLPRKLMIQTDNCWKDLKNQYVLSFYYFLVQINRR